MKTNIDAVYIHIPFCNKICNYCDFSKLYYNTIYVKKYLNSLSKEIDKYYNKEKIDTLYIGGGTPSCLSCNELKILFKSIKKLNISNKYEFTFECNIEDITYEKIKLLYNNGVNRISIGIQSLNRKIINKIGRNFYAKKDIIEKIKLIRKIGINNINIDLMFGVNESKNILKDISFFCKLNINHISTYSLVIEPHTIFYNLNIKSMNIEKEKKLYYKIINLMQKNNYIHYEISNFCKNGYECKHNLKYWINLKYYGFGLSSHGYISNYRYENTKSITNYIKEKYRLSKTILSKKVDMENYVMLSLRKISGINLEQFNKIFNTKFEDKYNIQNLLDNKYLIKENNHIKINPKYLYVSNTIISKILFANN